MQWTVQSQGMLMEKVLAAHQRHPPVAYAIEAHMSIWHDCCRVSTLSRIEHAIAQSRASLNSDSGEDQLETSILAMIMLSQVSVSAFIKQLMPLSADGTPSDAGRVCLDTTASAYFADDSKLSSRSLSPISRAGNLGAAGIAGCSRRPRHGRMDRR